MRYPRLALLSLPALVLASCHDSAPAFSAGGAAPVDEAVHAERRQQMLREIEADIRATRHYTGRKRFEARVMAAVGRVLRHEFVPADLRDRAYENRALPIGERQTISQPFIVALMTDLLRPRASDVVLEVGTGSGYQAAVLAELVKRVYTIEIVAPLGRAAEARLARLGYTNIVTRIGDGYAGWPEHAPFDGIIVTAAAREVPPPLIAQLKPGGRLVLPVKQVGGEEQLMVVTKTKSGAVHEQKILPVRFVPLTGDH